MSEFTSLDSAIVIAEEDKLTIVIEPTMDFDKFLTPTVRARLMEINARGRNRQRITLPTDDPNRQPKD